MEKNPILAKPSDAARVLSKLYNTPKGDFKDVVKAIDQTHHLPFLAEDVIFLTEQHSIIHQLVLGRGKLPLLARLLEYEDSTFIVSDAITPGEAGLFFAKCVGDDGVSHIDIDYWINSARRHTVFVTRHDGKMFVAAPVGAFVK